MQRSTRRMAAWRLSRVVVLAALGAALVQIAPPATAQSRAGKDDATVRAEVLALDKRRARAMVEGDVTLLDRITADDYTHVETTGVARDKAGFLALMRSGEVRFLSFDIDANEARLFGDVAVLTGSYTNLVKTASGTRSFKRARHQRVYVRQAGVWRAIAHQATEIPQADK